MLKYIGILRRGKMTKREIDRMLKPKTPLLIISISLIVLSVAMYIISASLKTGKEDAIDYRKLLFNYDNIEGEYTKLDIISFYSFAERDKLIYYYVQDEDGYVYVARLTDDTIDKIETAYDNSNGNENFTYTIYGYVRKVQSDLKKFIISEFDDAFDQKITSAEYDDWFSDTYIDEKLTGKITRHIFFLGAGVIFDIAAVIILIIYLKTSVQLKKVMKNYDYDIIASQLSSADTICYKKEGIYLTSQFIISSYTGLRLMSYSDIKWMYNLKHYTNGIPTGISLMAACSDKKLYSVASTSSRNEQTLIEVMARIHERNNNILIGYTDENIQLFNEYKKSN